MAKIDRRAPKDAIAKKNGFLVLNEKAIGATLRADGRRTQETYTDGGRLVAQARIVGEIKDEEILKLIPTAEGFKKLVYGVGVSITSDKQDSEMTFILKMYGRIDKYGGGTEAQMPVVTNGIEHILLLSEVDWSDDDDVLGQFAFVFPDELDKASVSVRLYVNDGFDVPPEIIDEKVDTSSPAYRALTDNSVYSVGNTARIKRAIAKARRGEDVMISYIGGSITQGAGAVPITTECYAYKSCRKFAEMFAKDPEKVHYVKAGMGGTPSELGITRFAMHALRDEVTDGADMYRGGVNEYKIKEQEHYPDIVFIEFAVNDEGDETKGDCFEGLCRMAWNSPGRPAVVIMFSVFADDSNLEARIRPIGEKLGLPMVSVKAAVTEQFKLTPEQGRIVSKKQYFYDMYHPTCLGHTIMSDCIAKYFKLADEAPEDKDTDELPVYRSNDFDAVRYFDRRATGWKVPENANSNNTSGTGTSDGIRVLYPDGSVKTENIKISEGMFTENDTDIQSCEIDLLSDLTPMQPANWMCPDKKTSSSPFRLELDCRVLLLVTKDSSRVDFGQADIIVDGKTARTYDPREIGWTHANAVIIIRDEKTAHHVVEIRPSAGNEDKRFTILGFSYI